MGENRYILCLNKSELPPLEPSDSQANGIMDNLTALIRGMLDWQI